MRAVALILERGPAAVGEVGERREEPGELDADLVFERGEAAWIEPCGVLVECIDKKPEGQVELELRRAPGQHDAGARVAARGQLGEQAGLADARLPDQHERNRFTALEPDHGAIQRTQLSGAPNEVLKDLGQPGIPFSASIGAPGNGTQIGSRIRVWRRCQGGGLTGMLVARLASWSITATSRTSAASRSRPSRATKARSATARRWPRASPAATRSGGRSRPQRAGRAAAA